MLINTGPVWRYNASLGWAHLDIKHDELRGRWPMENSPWGSHTCRTGCHSPSGSGTVASKQNKYISVPIVLQWTVTSLTLLVVGLCQCLRIESENRFSGTEDIALDFYFPPSHTHICMGKQNVCQERRCPLYKNMFTDKRKSLVPTLKSVLLTCSKTKAGVRDWKRQKLH